MQIPGQGSNEDFGACGSPDHGSGAATPRSPMFHEPAGPPSQHSLLGSTSTQRRPDQRVCDGGTQGHCSRCLSELVPFDMGGIKGYRRSAQPYIEAASRKSTRKLSALFRKFGSRVRCLARSNSKIRRKLDRGLRQPGCLHVQIREMLNQQALRQFLARRDPGQAL